MAAVRALAAGREAEQPRRHMLATLLALFVPRLGAAGGGGGAIVTLAMIAILAAVAFPAYQDCQQKAAVAGAYSAGVDASAKVERYLAEQGKIPTLAQAGVASSGASVLVFEPSMDENKRVAWACTAVGIRPTALPQGCK